MKVKTWQTVTKEGRGRKSGDNFDITCLDHNKRVLNSSARESHLFSQERSRGENRRCCSCKAMGCFPLCLRCCLLFLCHWSWLSLAYVLSQSSWAYTCTNCDKRTHIPGYLSLKAVLLRYQTLDQYVHKDISRILKEANPEKLDKKRQ